MQIKVGTKQTGPDLSKAAVWDQQSMAQVCTWSVATVVERTTQQGVGAAGEAFSDYSKKPPYISKASETGMRLSPKGGKPSKSGKSVRYDRGYDEYKESSRLGRITSARVDLVLSGQMMREVDAVEVTADEGVVSLRGQSRDYGTHVNDLRTFLGHHPAEMPDMDAEIADASKAASARAGNGGAPSTKPVI